MIILKNISKKFNKLEIFRNLDLSLKKDLITTIIGPSGYGKTTLLNIISGIEKPFEGGLVEIEPNCKLSYLLQENVMLPWRTLRDNIKLSWEMQDNSTNRDLEIINIYIERFGLKGFEGYYPETLSGGMKQRAALIRCLITEPDILLLDEPFGSLDFDIKLKIQRELLDYQKRKNATIIMVTHDIDDCIAMSDEVFVLSGKPAKIKINLEIDLGLKEKDPVLARKSEKFPYYFARLWDELKYLNNAD